MQAPDTLEHVASFVHHWIETETRRDLSLWVMVDSRERGVDLARRLFKLRMGEFAPLEIPFDTLPTYVANAHTNNRAFILSEESHIDTVLVTMQDDAADIVVREASPSESLYWYHQSKGRLPDLPESVAFLDQKMRPEAFTKRAPSLLMVDQAHPLWSRLVPFISDETQVMLTERVKTPPPTRS